MSLKAKVQIAGAEIELEGSEGELGRLIKELLGVGTASPGRRERPEKAPTGGLSEASGSVDERVFREIGSDLALMNLPTGPNVDADSMVLLIRGLSIKTGQEEVPATKLVKALKLSGLSVDRLDRIAKARPDLFSKSGERRGSRYRLTSKGSAWAQALLKQAETP